MALRQPCASADDGRTQAQPGSDSNRVAARM